MKLLLTSSGFSDKRLGEVFIRETKIIPKDSFILLVVYTQSPDEEFYVNESKKELKDLGFEKINVLNIGDQIDTSKLSDFDIIYVCGGNTFAILQKMKENKFDEFIVKQVKNGAIYVGVSAGSIIAGPNIEIAGWGSEADKNEVGLKDLRGLSLTNIQVFPHFREDLRGEVDSFKIQTNFPVAELANGEALFIEDEQIKMWKFEGSKLKSFKM